MAVRSFDLSEPQAPTLRALDALPVGRRARRRLRQRYATVAIASLAVPFAGAIIVLGAAH